MPRFSATELELKVLHDLSRCSFLPASYDKRFIRNVNSEANSIGVTEKQRPEIWRIALRYRKQLKRFGWSEDELKNGGQGMLQLSFMESFHAVGVGNISSDTRGERLGNVSTVRGKVRASEIFLSSKNRG